METQAIRLIALDLDGTVFNDDKEITPHTLAVLQRALDRGILVLPATGRPAMGIPQPLLALRGVNYAITSNGATVVQLHPHKILAQQYLTRQQSTAIYDFLGRYNCIITLFFGGGGFLERAMLEKLSGYVPQNLVRYIQQSRTPVPDLRQFMCQQPTGVEKFSIFFADEAQRDIALGEVAAAFGLRPVVGAPHNLEITALGVDKGAGLRALAAALDIPLAQTMAIGDSGNDLAMLQAAGCGVAMANASPEIKAAADFITRSNNADGVAWAVEQLAL